MQIFKILLHSCIGREIDKEADTERDPELWNTWLSLAKFIDLFDKHRQYHQTKNDRCKKYRPNVTNWLN